MSKSEQVLLRYSIEVVVINSMVKGRKFNVLLDFCCLMELKLICMAIIKPVNQVYP